LPLISKNGVSLAVVVVVVVVVSLVTVVVSSSPSFSDFALLPSSYDLDD